jgi:hypothetical protein
MPRDDLAGHGRPSSMTFNESIVEDAALTWFSDLGYAVAHGQHLGPGAVAAKMPSGY